MLYYGNDRWQICCRWERSERIKARRPPCTSKVVLDSLNPCCAIGTIAVGSAVAVWRPSVERNQLHDMCTSRLCQSTRLCSARKSPFKSSAPLPQSSSSSSPSSPAPSQPPSPSPSPPSAKPPYSPPSDSTN